MGYLTAFFFSCLKVNFQYWLLKTYWRFTLVKKKKKFALTLGENTNQKYQRRIRRMQNF